MHNYEDPVCQRIKRIAEESDNCIQLLHSTHCPYTRNMLLYQMKVKIDEILYLSDMMCGKINNIKNNPNGLLQQDKYNQQNQRDLTLEELTKFNGKDGNPAYVAVGGVVYDVTNNAAWAASTHFGLTAGKDLTGEFASCHAAGQSILNKLKIVGRLI